MNGNAVKTVSEKKTHLPSTVVVITIATLLVTGVLYRVHVSALQRSYRPTILETPLENLSMNINEWTGTDIHAPMIQQRLARHDDFISRKYINQENSQWAHLYVAFSGSPRAMLGHNPRICYVAGGWAHISSRQGSFTTKAGRLVNCWIHRFNKPFPHQDEIVVINFYILNGQLVSDEERFSGLRWRTPNISEASARYVVQVQISAAFENSAIEAAKQMTDRLVDFFPGENGIIKVFDNFAKSKL